jgi:hypothetical protein
VNEPVSFPDSVYDRIAAFLPAELRISYYRYVAHVRTLQPNDDFVVIIQGMGILALLCRQVPDAVAAEREKLLAEFAGLCRKHEAATERAANSLDKMFSAHQKLLEQNMGTWQSREQQAVKALEGIARDFGKSTDEAAARIRTAATTIEIAANEQKGAAQAAQRWINRISLGQQYWPLVACVALGALAGFVADRFLPK